jgi:molybdopterin-guanine dinucleotide biosynthesis protein A
VTEPYETIGVVLAGGQASRLPDKPFRLLRRLPLIERVIARVTRQVDDLWISVRGDTARYETFGLPLLLDADPDSQGPLAGIVAALEAASLRGAKRVAFVPCDAPFVPLDLVTRLAVAAPRGLAVPAHGGRMQQSFGLWDVTLAPRVREAFVAGERRLYALVESLGAVTVPFDEVEEDPFFNVNTEDDLREAEARLAAS